MVLTFDVCWWRAVWRFGILGNSINAVKRVFDWLPIDVNYEPLIVLGRDLRHHLNPAMISTQASWCQSLVRRSCLSNNDGTDHVSFGQWVQRLQRKRSTHVQPNSSFIHHRTRVRHRFNCRDNLKNAVGIIRMIGAGRATHGHGQISLWGWTRCQIMKSDVGGALGFYRTVRFLCYVEDTSAIYFEHQSQASRICYSVVVNRCSKSVRPDHSIHSIQLSFRTHRCCARWPFSLPSSRY